MQSNPLKDRKKQIFDSDSQSNEDEDEEEEQNKGRKINGKQHRENKAGISQNIHKNAPKFNQNPSSKPALSQSQTQKKKPFEVEGKTKKNVEDDQISDDYDPENSQQDFQNSYSDDEDENEDQNDSDEESDSVKIYKAKKPPQVFKKHSASSALKKQASAEKKPQEVSKKRRKKRKRRVIMKIILGEQNNIDSVDPFLKNLCGTVAQTKNINNKIQTILLKNADKQKFIYEFEGETRKRPMLKDFVSFCAQSALKSCHLDGKVVIEHFNIPVSQNREQEISLIQSLIQPFLHPNLKRIYNEEQLKQSLYEIRLLQEISTFKELEQFENPENEYRKDSVKKIEALKQILLRGHIKVIFEKAEVDLQKGKKNRKQKMHNMKFEEMEMGDNEMKVEQKNEEMFHEESLMKDYFNKEIEQEQQIFEDQDQS